MISSLRPLVIRTLLAVFCLSAAIATPEISAQQLPSPELLSRYGLEMGWWGYAVINSQRDKIRNISFTEEMVFMQSAGGYITAFDAETGKRMWVSKPGLFDAATFAVTANRELAVVVSGLKIFALDLQSGHQLWELDSPQFPSTAVALDKDRLYFGTLYGTVFAYDLYKVKELFEAGKLPQFTESAEVWRYRTSQEITTTPLIMKDLLIFASRNGSVFCVDGKSRKLHYRFETDSAITAPLTTDGKQLFVASEDYNNYSIDPRDGTVNWHYVSGFPIKQAPIPVGDQLFITPRGGGLTSIDAKTGVRNWDSNLANADHFLGVSKTRIFAGDFLQNLLILDRSTGRLEGKIPMKMCNVWPGNPRTDRIFVANEAGLIIMLRERSQEFPIYHIAPEERPLLPEFATEGGSGSAPVPAPNNPLRKPEEAPKDEPKKPVVIPFPSAF